ncbi:MAG: MutS-related protein [Chitinophagaceae bacterium]
MQIDQTTLNDLSIFQQDEEYSVFHHLNFTQTTDGKFYLRQILSNPLKNINEINDVQNAIKQLIGIHNQFPKTITNGTIMVLERFYETSISNIPQPATHINTFFYKLFSTADFSLIKYSVQHFINFINGLNKVAALLKPSTSKLVQFWIDKIEVLCNRPKLQEMLKNMGEIKNTSNQTILNYAAYFRYHFKQDCLELIEVFSKIDAYMSLAIACRKHQLEFPQFVESKEPLLVTKSLFHLLLSAPTSYNIELKKDDNFLFLTGANMAGKSTFIKATGVAVYLAHIGIGVPAQQMKLSYFDGLLSNIHIVDNIFKNESYFFNEVQRVKNTVEKVGDNKKWLILIDELFKGTNIQDAMKCSTTVIQGLQKRENGVFILSTHLYEIGNDLKQFKNIQFKYFETKINNKELEFSYQLKDGISNDRLGYLILEREGVVALLKNNT